MACAALPYCPYRPDGQPGRSKSPCGCSLYQDVTFDVQCEGANQRHATSPRGAGLFLCFSAAGRQSHECMPGGCFPAFRSCRASGRAPPASCGAHLRVDALPLRHRLYRPPTACRGQGGAKSRAGALELIDKTRDFPARCNLNGTWVWQVEQFYNIATPGRYKQKFEQAVREHRIEVDPM